MLSIEAVINCGALSYLFHRVEAHMIISFGNYILDINQVFIIYPVMFCLILASVGAVAGFIWVCLTPGGDPIFSIPRINRSGSKE
jgi:hypothetical protein